MQTGKRRGATVPIDDLRETLAASPSSPESEFAEREEREQFRKRLRTAVSDLPQSLRSCLLLWLNGYEYSEIQEILGITLDAVKSRLRDARKRLRKSFDSAR